ncbi:hypothetical protein SAMN05428988_0122 [Chitinophaga sp. YR573]|uniref:hypothetical protein n=1 Tax=Chitinophaga sp. YR573 TaxID=1881040 RepID=UPI0008D62184|nr:hypothetical protein [Chitinophaga sp. YR573]SEV88588.1 hypothetical protein SAMN05428988_0122 [Chitinophaga sp. YR573]
MSDITVDKLQDLEKKYKKIFELSAKLRHHQIRHIKFKTSVDFDKGVYYARQLDHFIKEELKEIPKSEQQELFK